MIVMKFGGTSVEDAKALDRVASIVQKLHARTLTPHNLACVEAAAFSRRTTWQRVNRWATIAATDIQSNND